MSSKQRAELSKVYGRVLADLALSPDELREKVDYYREREALLTRHAGELSDRVAERDREIAERLRTEAELNRLAAAVEQAFEAVVIVGTDGSIHYVNPAFERITGYARGEVLGQPAGPLLGPDRRGLVEEILAEGRPREGTFTTSSREGRAVVIAGTVTPVRDEAGRIVDYVAVGRDVTEEQSLQERVRRVQKMDALGTLAGGIAHDFNNILQPILSFAQLVQATLPADHVASTHAGSVVAAALRARALVEQILAFARRSEQERHPVAIVAILKETLKFLRASLPATVELRMEIASDEVYVQADPTQLHQVVLNLVTNAAQAIGDSGGVVTVTLEPADAAPPALAASQPRLARGDVVRLAVADTGVGMDPETIERIFEPFFTTRGPGGGTGLGLAVAHGIVEAHGGALAVRSEPGRGSTFEVYLPTTEPAAPGADGGAVGAAVAAQRILVVDDEPAITEVERRILEEHGHRVVVAHDGSEALERFRADPDAFDVILSDQTMPGLRGSRWPRRCGASARASRSCSARASTGPSTPSRSRRWGSTGSSPSRSPLPSCCERSRMPWAPRRTAGEPTARPGAAPPESAAAPRSG